MSKQEKTVSSMTVDELLNSLKEESSSKEKQAIIEKLDKLVQLITTKKNPDEDPSVLANQIFHSTNQIVPQLLNYGQIDLALIMACFNALLVEIFIFDGPQPAVAAGMKKLVSMLTTDQNSAAKLILDTFSEEE